MARGYDYTPERHVKLMHKRQGGVCAVKGCDVELHLERPRNFIIEHLHQLAMKGSNALKNKRLYCVPHASKKTNGTKATSYGSDTHARAKVRRLRGENKPKMKRPIPSQKLKGRSNWPKRGTQKMRSGKIRP